MRTGRTCRSACIPPDEPCARSLRHSPRSRQFPVSVVFTTDSSGGKLPESSTWDFGEAHPPDIVRPAEALRRRERSANRLYV